jgi:GntR family transcriptional regulator, transcriptional repressor for pyruvate dehydrogenase complex
MLKVVKKQRAYEGVVRQIRGLIEKGRFKHGDQLPTERELCETFKLSRATVREAIRSLESMNLVESRQGNGTYVIASSEEALVHPLAAALFHKKDDISDIFSIRGMIEPDVAQLAAEKATVEDIHELERILASQERDISTGANTVGTNTSFHHCLARMAKNRVLERLLLALIELLSEIRERHLQSEDRQKKSYLGHQAILAAIRERNGAAARLAMRRHLEEVERVIILKRKGGG